MDDNNNEHGEPPNNGADIEALSDAIQLAPIGVLSLKTINQLVDLRGRLIAEAGTKPAPKP